MMLLDVILAANGRLLLRPPRLSQFNNANPLFIAHRGGWFRGPEHTFEGYDISRALGVAAIEQDVWGLTDGGLGIMHDTTVDRTTNGTGDAASFSTTTFQALTADASAWFPSASSPDQPALIFQEVLVRYQGAILLVPEVKNSEGVAPLLAALNSSGIDKDQVLVQSFSLTHLAPFTAAGYETIYLTSTGLQDRDAVWNAGVRWVGISETLDDATISLWVARGFKVIPYTVGRRQDRDRLLALGCVGMFTPDPEYLRTNSPERTTDNFAAQRWQRGMINVDFNVNSDTRGRFYAPASWGFPAATNTSEPFVLQGWACPVGGNPANDSWSVTTDVTYVSALSGDQTRWAGIFMASLAVGDLGVTGVNRTGYNCFIRKNGALHVFRVASGTATQIGTATSAAIADGEEIRMRMTVSPTQITLQRLTLAGAVVQTVTVTDTTHARSGYFHFGRNAVEPRFRNVQIG